MVQAQETPAGGNGTGGPARGGGARVRPQVLAHGATLAPFPQPSGGDAAGPPLPPRLSALAFRPRSPDRPDGPQAEARQSALLARLLRDDLIEPGALLRALARRPPPARPTVPAPSLAAAPPRIAGAEPARLLCAETALGGAALARAEARLRGTGLIDPARDGPPDVRLIDARGVEACLRDGVVPWRRAGGVTLVAVADAPAFEARAAELAARFGPLAVAMIAPEALRAALVAVRGEQLVRRAEVCVSASESCRGIRIGRMRALAAAALVSVLLAVVLAPVTVLAILTLVAVLVLVVVTALKLAAAIAALTARRAGAAAPPPAADHDLPAISILVPLFRERDIAGRLLTRLARLDYPRDRLEVLLVVEAVDAVTRATLARLHLPGWMRVVVVPDGRPRTKPRALNYALTQAGGAIVGIYDAEDAPAPDQLRRVAAAFATAAPEVACLQGRLDYYNPRSTWLARCFTVEYATWFGLVLPGLARLGLVVPLGGTTLFLRREVIEAIGGWDAHNVTEDADLGLRLARRGWRTELIDTVTAEEANCRLLPWVRQRSRWIKGYALTWAVHMRDPLRLWRDLGTGRFLGVQAIFLGSLVQTTLAPVLWSFWVLALGFGHPLLTVAPTAALLALAGLFVLAEAVTITLGVIAVSADRRHRFLRPWVPTLHLYYPLATLAAAKAAAELLAAPFYWDKTTHGVYDRAAASGAPGGRRARAPA